MGSLKPKYVVPIVEKYFLSNDKKESNYYNIEEHSSTSHISITDVPRKYYNSKRETHNYELSLMSNDLDILLFYRTETLDQLFSVCNKLNTDVLRAVAEIINELPSISNLKYVNLGFPKRRYTHIKNLPKDLKKLHKDIQNTEKQKIYNHSEKGKETHQKYTRTDDAKKLKYERDKRYRQKKKADIEELLLFISKL